MNKYEEILTDYETRISDDELAKNVSKIIVEKVPGNRTQVVKKFLFGSIELTSLKPTDNDRSIIELTEKVNDFADVYPDLPHVAAICVYPCFATAVSNALQVDGVEVACVSGGFPSSQTFIEVKVAETALAIKDGATEIDTVMSIGKLQGGDYETVCDEISELKAVCGERKMKVIIESGCLKNFQEIKTASLLSMYAGADFVKTSTGKEKVSATAEAAYIICCSIKEYYEKTGIQIGFKVAGGINSVDDAITYYTIVKEVLGEQWLTHQWFRIGTSRLANLLLGEITGEETRFF